MALTLAQVAGDPRYAWMFDRRLDRDFGPGEPQYFGPTTEGGPDGWYVGHPSNQIQNYDPATRTQTLPVSTPDGLQARQRFDLRGNPVSVVEVAPGWQPWMPGQGGYSIHTSDFMGVSDVIALGSIAATPFLVGAFTGAAAVAAEVIPGAVASSGAAAGVTGASSVALKAVTTAATSSAEAALTGEAVGAAAQEAAAASLLTPADLGIPPLVGEAVGAHAQELAAENMLTPADLAGSSVALPGVGATVRALAAPAAAALRTALTGESTTTPSGGTSSSSTNFTTIALLAVGGFVAWRAFAG